MSTIPNLAAEDKAEIKTILRSYQYAGVENPLLPTDVDLDGDGTADSFGLDDEGNVILVPGVRLESTVYLSDGDDIKGDD